MQSEYFVMLIRAPPVCVRVRQRCHRVRVWTVRFSVRRDAAWTPRAAPPASVTTRASRSDAGTASSAGRCLSAAWPDRVRRWRSVCRPWPTRVRPGGRCPVSAAAPDSRRVRAATCATSARSTNTMSAVPSRVSIEGEGGATNGDRSELEWDRWRLVGYVDYFTTLRKEITYCCVIG